MIYIKEAQPKRVSGLTSLFLKFDFNQDVIDVIKEFSPHVYNKTTQVWELPVCFLAQLLDRLTVLDDVSLMLFDEPELVLTEANKPMTEEEISSFKVKLLPHQIEDVNYGLIHPKFLNLNLMGMGKTLETIALAKTLKSRGLIDHCIVICCVNAVKRNWISEIHKFTDESCKILGEKITKAGRSAIGTVADRTKALLSDIEEFFIVTNIESLRSADLTKAMNKFISFHEGRVLVAVDEIHRGSNKSSDQGNNLLKVKSNYQVALTGTPITNNPMSAYGPASWIDIDKSTLTNFKAQYCVWGGFRQSEVIGYKNLDLLQDELDSVSIRRSLKDIRTDMPEKIITTEVVEMSEEHRDFYEAIKEGVKEEADKIELKAGNLLALTTRLRQATSCPSVLTSQNIVSSKVTRCVELVEDLISQDEKVVIFSNFKETVNILADLLKSYSPLLITGDVDDAKAAANVEKFQNDPSSKVCILTFGKGSTGITLNAASYLIAIDETWTAASNNQAWDRIYRVNNTHSANIIILMNSDTIDERVHEIVEKKKDLSDFLIDGVENNVALSLKDELVGILSDL